MILLAAAALASVAFAQPLKLAPPTPQECGDAALKRLSDSTAGLAPKEVPAGCPKGIEISVPFKPRHADPPNAPALAASKPGALALPGTQTGQSVLVDVQDIAESLGIDLHDGGYADVVAKSLNFKGKKVVVTIRY